MARCFSVKKKLKSTPSYITEMLLIGIRQICRKAPIWGNSKAGIQNVK